MIGAFQSNAFQSNAFQEDSIVPPIVVGTTRGGIYWKPAEEYEWPDLPGDVLSAVHAAVAELATDSATEEAPTVAEVVRAVQPRAFAMPPEIDMADLAQKITAAATLAIQQWRDMEEAAAEADDEEALLALLH